MNPSGNITYNITKHCLKRYIERVLGGLNNSPNIYLEILMMLKTGVNVTSKLSEKHTRFILYVKDRYGKRGYNFIKKDHTLFILSKRKGTEKIYDVITCYTEDENTYKIFDNSALSKNEIYFKLSEL